MARTRRLALVIHGLSGGGAERVMADMANHWARHGVDVTLITLAAANTDVYPIEASVQRVGLDAMRESRGLVAAVRNNLRRATALRRALRLARPDFVISFTDQINVLALLATLGTRLPVIVCERSDPRHHPLGHVWSMLRRRCYRRCFAAVVQTKTVRGIVQPLCGRRPVYVIPNVASRDGRRFAPTGELPASELPASKHTDGGAADGRHTNGAPAGVEPTRNEPTSVDSGRPCRLIAMGRLSPEKGFDLLIEAFARLAERHPHWTLDIFGAGPERDALQRQIAGLKLEQRVHVRGWTDDPWAEFSRAGLFVLSSHYEGFPNALLDAMACGLPAVSFDCPSGPAEIIRHTIDGLLAEPDNVAALADALHQLMADEGLRCDYGARAVDVLDRFSADRFYARWEAVFAGAATDDPRFSPAAPEDST